ncbi:MAG: histidinol phosphate phosphatase domain-containing protein [Dehalococcoidia bacterium]|jgi:histidinol phosphatase-like PHP family hydrolase|nr:histidinol phosphate phosphatase domain-containing protein [Dehalococcoidia bacterium]
MIYDFHTHTYLSDGVLSPLELIRTAHVQDYKVIAVTDHVGLEDQERVIKTLLAECRRATEAWGIMALAGVEITHVPKSLIGDAAQRAKDLGAQIVLVHGETIVEPVEPGSNLAALGSSNVDILAHPGLITEEEASLAAARGIFLELSARRGHSLTNGHVARVGLSGGAKLLLDSDAHNPEDLFTTDLIGKIARGAGLSGEETATLLESNPPVLLERYGLMTQAG